MLSFYYDCVDRFLQRDDFQYVCMDTDSAYIALSDSFENLTKHRPDFLEEKNAWLPRSDTPENFMHDKREPGLFKEEWCGDGCIALCSKTYFCFGPKTSKHSCKGLNKCQKRPLTAQRYMEVLTNKEPGAGTNRGFRM